MFQVKEVMCKSILSESKISDLALNPYNGCSNGCKYCYVRFMKRRLRNAPISTGVVEAKINAPTVLLKQIKRMKKPRKVMMSSVCDAWQQPEEEYKISRKCLEILLQFDFPVTIHFERRRPESKPPLRFFGGVTFFLSASCATMPSEKSDCRTGPQR